MHKSMFTLLAIFVSAAMLFSACAPAAATAAPAAPAAPAATAAPAASNNTPAAVAAPTDTPVAAAAVPAATPTEPLPTQATGYKGTKIRWFVGLGSGGNPEEIRKEVAFVNKFNAKYGDKYYLVMEAVQSKMSVDVLQTEIASGDTPDIVGPVGIKGMFQFEGAWLDLKDQIAKNKTDLSDFDPKMVDLYKMGPQGQIGLPFAIYPSAFWYNTDLFDEAGLAYPPHKYGAQYVGKDGKSLPWDFNTMKQLALKLTVDKTGNDATQPKFDPKNIVQWGYDATWMDVRGEWNTLAPSSFVAADGKTAVISPEYRTAAHWFYDGMWKDHFIPTGPESASDYLAQTNTFASGHIAMMPNHTWYTCCFQKANWDLAAIPSFNGKTTATMNADTFGILKTSKNQDAAYQVLNLMLGEFAPDLLSLYGAFPARQTLQKDAMASMQKQFPKADLQLFIDGIQYPDNPNYESGMPNYLKSYDIYAKFYQTYTTKSDLDLDKSLDQLAKDLQVSFDTK